MITSELTNKEILLKDVKQHLLLLWENDKIVLQNLYKILKTVSIDMFFMDIIMVPPSKFRRVCISYDCFQKSYQCSSIHFIKHKACKCCIMNVLWKCISEIKIPFCYILEHMLQYLCAFFVHLCASTSKKASACVLVLPLITFLKPCIIVHLRSLIYIA